MCDGERAYVCRVDTTVVSCRARICHSCAPVGIITMRLIADSSVTFAYTDHGLVVDSAGTTALKPGCEVLCINEIPPLINKRDAKKHAFLCSALDRAIAFAFSTTIDRLKSLLAKLEAEIVMPINAFVQTADSPVVIVYKSRTHRNPTVRMAVDTDTEYPMSVLLEKLMACTYYGCPPDPQRKRDTLAAAWIGYAAAINISALETARPTYAEETVLGETPYLRPIECGLFCEFAVFFVDVFERFRLLAGPGTNDVSDERARSLECLWNQNGTANVTPPTSLAEMVAHEIQEKCDPSMHAAITDASFVLPSPI